KINSLDRWPNMQTLINTGNLANSVACIIFKNPFLEGLNISCRSLATLITVYYRGDRKNGMLQQLAVAVIFGLGRKGCYLSVTIDLASEAINYYRLRRSSSVINKNHDASIKPGSILAGKRIDPKVPENAARILNVPSDRINDKEYIEHQKLGAIKDLTTTKNTLDKDKSGRDPFAVEIQGLIDDTNAAYTTLMSAIDNKPE
ncbi:MAG: hypothetical protein ACRDFB_01420, partial [Rhabdochlamydiaceae bacterium]